MRLAHSGLFGRLVRLADIPKEDFVKYVGENVQINENGELCIWITPDEQPATLGETTTLDDGFRLG